MSELESKGDAATLLRLERAVTTSWVFHQIHRFHQSTGDISILDVGCGHGSLTIELASAGLKCTGLDVSDEILNVGRSRANGQQGIQWVLGNATALPFPEASFDVVALMDVLEHIEEPKQALAEAARVLKPGGTILFHAFNRTPQGWFFAAKGLDWFVKEAPSSGHEWKRFVRPDEIRAWLVELGFNALRFQGIQPKVLSPAFLRLMLTRRVPESLHFKMSDDLSVGYMGAARHGALQC